MTWQPDLDINSMYAYPQDLDGILKILSRPKFVKGATEITSHGEAWHDVMCFVPDLAAWIRGQPDALWAETTYSSSRQYRAHFTIHESLLTYVQLRWA
jgi:hypothetical protein